jgi:putative endonuclease
MQKQYAVYILTNQSHRVLYTGMTNDLVRRTYEHTHGKIPGFTQKYQAHKLVYYELTETPVAAIQREKQIKNLVRRKKIAMINAFNPMWKDLYNDIV